MIMVGHGQIYRCMEWQAERIPAGGLIISQCGKPKPGVKKQGFNEDRHGLDVLKFGFHNHQNLVTQSDVMISICYNHGEVHPRCITRTSTFRFGIVRTGHIMIAAIPD